MVRGIPREAEAGIGVGFLVGMIVLLIIAIQTFEGTVTFLLLVFAGVFLLLGLFFLNGTQRASSGDLEAGGAGNPPGVVEESAGVPAFKSASAMEAMVVCPNCRQPLSARDRACPRCGHQI